MTEMVLGFISICACECVVFGGFLYLLFFFDVCFIMHVLGSSFVFWSAGGSLLLFCALKRFVIHLPLPF